MAHRPTKTASAKELFNMTTSQCVLRRHFRVEYWVQPRTASQDWKPGPQARRPSLVHRQLVTQQSALFSPWHQPLGLTSRHIVSSIWSLATVLRDWQKGNSPERVAVRVWFVSKVRIMPSTTFAFFPFSVVRLPAILSLVGKPPGPVNLEVFRFFWSCVVWPHAVLVFFFLFRWLASPLLLLPSRCRYMDVHVAGRLLNSSRTLPMQGSAEQGKS
jgi:hypothetical protein